MFDFELPIAESRSVEIAERIGATLARIHFLGVKFMGPGQIFTPDNSKGRQTGMPKLLDFL